MPALTVMSTVSAVEVFTPSLTVSENVRVTSSGNPVGAVNVGFAGSVVSSVTADPSPESGAVCVQAYVSVAPSGSELALPSRVTASPSQTVRSAPASALGASFVPALTVMSTVSAVEAFTPSLTVSENVRVTSSGNPVGAVNVGFAGSVVSSVTADPSPESGAVCVQAYVSVAPSGSELALPSRVTASPSQTV